MLWMKVNVLIVVCFSTSILCGNIVEELRQRVNDVANECVDAENKTHPAFKCSGLLIRGIKLRDGMKFAWSLKLGDKEKNSLPFAYLRRDHPFGNLGKGYDAGIIMFPHLKTPPHKSTQKVLCTFPYDAFTDKRDVRGCGRHEWDKTGSSEPCHTQNVTTASQWIEHFKSINWANMLQCGFQMTEETATENFAVALQANTFIQNEGMAFFSSELRFEGWDENNVKSIPIQAFFYLIGNDDGYQNAVRYQDEYYAQSGGEMVPIVGIKFKYNDTNIQIIGDEVSSEQIQTENKDSKN